MWIPWYIENSIFFLPFSEFCSSLCPSMQFSLELEWLNLLSEPSVKSHWSRLSWWWESPIQKRTASWRLWIGRELKTTSQTSAITYNPMSSRENWTKNPNWVSLFVQTREPSSSRSFFLSPSSPCAAAAFACAAAVPQEKLGLYMPNPLPGIRAFHSRKFKIKTLINENKLQKIKILKLK